MSEKLSYVQQLETRIAETKATLEQLKSEKENVMLTAQHEEIENLEKYLDQAHVNVRDLSAAAEDAWHELKESMDQLMENINAHLKRLLGGSDDGH
ncbi:MAG: hypothetical protein AAGA75_21240 [Cyanobacteria bacterium P01_E01_bin.6]